MSFTHKGPEHALDRELAPLSEIRTELVRWLVEHAYPLWWRRGADHIRGGFHERLTQSGEPLDEPRRARLHPRQAYAFAVADDLGCDGLTDPAVRHALSFFLAHYVRDDGFVRACVGPDGGRVDDSVVLYDQTFALLGYATWFEVTMDESLRVRAVRLLESLYARLGNRAGGFRESFDGGWATSNSHMHLLEAALAWMALDADRRWRDLAALIVELVTTRFAHPGSGQILEFFSDDLRAAPSLQGRIVEPGHQFEWAWLLLRWCAVSPDDGVTSFALRLIGTAEASVDSVRDVAMNALLLDGKVHDARARLWPQTERLKAACIAWEVTRSRHHLRHALRAARSLHSYLDTAVPGLWLDCKSADGELVDEPAPASSFYHIAAAVLELDGTLNRIEGSSGARRHTLNKTNIRMY